MGDLFWNKVAGVVIGGILVVILIMEFGHILVPSHAAEELTPENTAYPVDWAALNSGAGAAEEEVEEGPTDYGLVLAAANIDAGARAFRRCQSCHTIEAGGANGTGPNLYDIVNRDIASVAGARYSNTLSEMDGTWTYEALDGFLENPRGYANGTNMSFAGLRNDEERFNLIAYLRDQAPSPAALPAPLAAAEEAVEEMMEDAADAADAVIEDAADAAEDLVADAPAEEDTPAEEGGEE